MKRRVGSAGFTIVETMVVLAVTGGLFVLMVGTLAGRQRSNEFTQSINDARTELQQVITETRTGYYPSSENFRCDVSGGNLSISKAIIGNRAQGENGDCVFLGKLLQFNVQVAPDNVVTIYPVAGVRTAKDLSLADAQVVVHGATVDESTDFLLKYGLKVVKMQALAPDGTSKDIDTFGVLSSLTSSNPGDDGLNAPSGDQQFDLYVLASPLNGSQLDDTTSLSAPGAVLKNPAGGVKICFQSGTTNKYALITIGNNGSQLSADLKIMDMGALPCGLS